MARTTIFPKNDSFAPTGNTYDGNERLTQAKSSWADYFFIARKQIVVDEKKLNGRWGTPHNQEFPSPRWRNLSRKDGGQLQPVQVRRIAAHKVQLVLGYRRFTHRV